MLLQVPDSDESLFTLIGPTILVQTYEGIINMTTAKTSHLSPQFQIVAHLGLEDAEHLQDKDKSYGSSWRKRGGVGAFMMLSRKWDRLEQMCSDAGYDIFKLIQEELDSEQTASGIAEPILDQLRDLRRYLFLVDSWMILQTGNPYLSHNGPVQVRNGDQACTTAQMDPTASPHYNPDNVRSMGLSKAVELGALSEEEADIIRGHRDAQSLHSFPQRRSQARDDGPNYGEGDGITPTTLVRGRKSEKPFGVCLDCGLQDCKCPPIEG